MAGIGAGLLGLGYLDSQMKIQVHFQLLLAAASLFTIGGVLYLWGFFRKNPKRGLDFSGGGG